MGGFWEYFATHHFSFNYHVASIWAKFEIFGLLFIPISGHTDQEIDFGNNSWHTICTKDEKVRDNGGKISLIHVSQKTELDILKIAQAMENFRSRWWTTVPAPW